MMEWLKSVFLKGMFIYFYSKDERDLSKWNGQYILSIFYQIWTNIQTIGYRN